MTAAPLGNALAGLDNRLSGSVVGPDQDGWDVRRRPWMARFFDIDPAAIAYPVDAADVAAVMRYVEQECVPWAVRSGGHDFAGRSTTTGLLLDTSQLGSVALAGTTARIGAGARLGEVYRRLAEHGRTIPGGCGSTVGIAGLALGGGLGVLGRRYGLLSDWLRAATVVTADGRIVTCDDDQHPDLFWALRGAGHGHLAVVTELVFDTVPAPACDVFQIRWPSAAARDVIAAWQSWAPAVDGRVAASLLLNTSTDPAEPLQVLVLGIAHDLEPGATRQQLDDFTALVANRPLQRTRRSMPWLAAKAEMARLAPGADLPAVHSRSEFHATPLPLSAIDALVDALVDTRIPGQARELDFTPWRGAYNDRALDETAFPHRNAHFLLKHTATFDTGRPAASTPPPWLNRSWTIAHANGTGGVYPNFPDPDLADPATAYWLRNAPRVAHIKGTWDPTGLLPSAVQDQPRAMP